MQYRKRFCDTDTSKGTGTDRFKLWKERFYRCLGFLLLLMFLPILVCVMFVGNRMNYMYKLETVLSNQILSLIALLGLGGIILLLIWASKYELDRKTNFFANVTLSIAFIILFFVNIRIAKEIVFRLPWDIAVVNEYAYQVAHKESLGYNVYFSMYPHNISITYILGRIYRVAWDREAYQDAWDFIWIQGNCILFSLGGMFSCLTVKRVTKKLMPTVFCFLIYVALIGISPWKLAAYTDTYGMVFPIMAIYFYICYQEDGRKGKRVCEIILSLAAGMAGGIIKSSVYLVVIAILGMEFLQFLTDRKNRWNFFALGLCIVLALWIGTKCYKEHIMREMDLEISREVSADWQHYFLMGLNENTTGGYNSEDVSMLGAFESSSERHKAQIERAMERISERGFFGTLYFYLRKMVMNYNDGTFGWGTEIWPHDYYRRDLASNTRLTELLRNIFWCDAAYTGRYNTFCQMVWIFCMLGFPGIALSRAEKRDGQWIFVVCLLGILFYQMLFEARGRYLFVFLPLMVAMSIIGFCRYADRLAEIRRRLC